MNYDDHTYGPDKIHRDIDARLSILERQVRHGANAYPPISPFLDQTLDTPTNAELRAKLLTARQDLAARTAVIADAKRQLGVREGEGIIAAIDRFRAMRADAERECEDLRDKLAAAGARALTKERETDAHKESRDRAWESNLRLERKLIALKMDRRTDQPVDTVRLEQANKRLNETIAHMDEKLRLRDKRITELQLRVAERDAARADLKRGVESWETLFSQRESGKDLRVQTRPSPANPFLHPIVTP